MEHERNIIQYINQLNDEMCIVTYVQNTKFLNPWICKQSSAIFNNSNELQTIYKNEKLSYEYCLRENDQLKSQNEHLLGELARLTTIETRDRTRSSEQADLRRQYDDILNQYNELKRNCNEINENVQENQLRYENDIKYLNDENVKFRLHQR